MQRSFTNILCVDVIKSSEFYTSLLGLKIHFESDWFIILTHEKMPGFEFGILQRDHDIVPKAIRSNPSGVIVTFVVEDCEAIYQKAIEMDVTIIEEPTNMFYGQRRLLVKDPDGTVLDISSLSHG